MRRINPAKAGLAVGVVIGLWHAIWITLVAVGWAKLVLDFVLRLHFINLTYEVVPFALSTGLMLVAITFVLGAAFGVVFALVWNWLSGSPGKNAAAEQGGVGSAT